MKCGVCGALIQFIAPHCPRCGKPMEGTLQQNIQSAERCPECRRKLIKQDGCSYCVCGWAACG